MGAPARTRPRQSLPPRRSTEEISARRAAVYGGEHETLSAEDFSDVFGGPPRTVLSRRLSAGDDFARSPAVNPFYEEIFGQPDATVARRAGRNLPDFRIPAGSRERSEGFYSDIFGIGKEEDDLWRSRSKSKSKSKSNSSSVLSSEELSPLRLSVAGGDEASFSSFASKLR